MGLEMIQNDPETTKFAIVLGITKSDFLSNSQSDF